MGPVISHEGVQVDENMIDVEITNTPDVVLVANLKVYQPRQHFPRCDHQPQVKSTFPPLVTPVLFPHRPRPNLTYLPTRPYLLSSFLYRYAAKSNQI